MNLASAADRLGVHYQTVWRWVHTGHLPAVKRAGTYEVDATDVERLRLERTTPRRPSANGCWRCWPPIRPAGPGQLPGGDPAR